LTRRISIDSTYLLPGVGIQVEELAERSLNLFFRILSERGYQVVLSDVALIEVLGKSLRHTLGSERLIERVRDGYLSILTEERFHIVSHASPSIFEIALDLKVNGLEDLFDCLITGTAIAESSGLVTEDREIPRVIDKTEYSYFPILNLNEFLSQTGVTKARQDSNR